MFTSVLFDGDGADLQDQNIYKNKGFQREGKGISVRDLKIDTNLFVFISFMKIPLLFF